MSRYFIFIPNLLSIVRIALVYPILNNIFLGNFVVSIIYFVIASITDALDAKITLKVSLSILESAKSEKIIVI